MVAVELSRAYGLVLFELVFSVLLHYAWMSSQVGQARWKYHVPYPVMYASADVQEAKKFNCVQRGHQNSLENWPAHAVLTLVAGLKFPLLAFFSGALYDFGRIVYFNGYATGEPTRRLKGQFQHLGTVIQLILVVLMGFKFLAGKF